MIEYKDWKEYLLEKQNLSREYHIIIPTRKTELRIKIANLEKLVMGVPDYYWSDYIKECKRK
jgi:hypothetical protein